MSVMAIDESGYYVLDTQGNKLHGADGGPFPYSKKSVAEAEIFMRELLAELGWSDWL
jgi:hypothetical protein